jgi:transposase
MVTDHQVRRLFRLSNTEPTQEIAATKAGMDVKTARKYLRSARLPSEQKAERRWRTRPDPFQEVWEGLRTQLNDSPTLEAKTLFEALQREHPGRFADGQLRTLQRKIKTWRASEGPAQEVYFAQQHVPGRLCQSDFTGLKDLGVTIGRQSFPHLVYHFVLTYSNWESVMICPSETLESLSQGLQQALWRLGGVPEIHQTDRLTAAVNNLQSEGQFQERYQALLRHYGLIGQRIQTAKPEQNGDVEQSHHRFQRAVEQALLLRGSREFASRADYNAFLEQLVAQRNAGRTARLAQEIERLRPLPATRLDGLVRLTVRVTSGSLIWVYNNQYSVPSRLIGERVQVRLYAEHLEVWYAQKQVAVLERIRGQGKHKVDYRHIIEWLVRKPGAFDGYRYQADLFPTSRFRIAYEALRAADTQQGTRDYLAVLQLAAEQGEARVDAALRQTLADEEVPTPQAVAAHLEQPVSPITAVQIAPVVLTDFDQLLTLSGERS